MERRPPVSCVEGACHFRPRITHRRARAAGVVMLLGACVVAPQAQTSTRRLTTVDAVQEFPGFFHLQNVLLRGEFVERGTSLVLRADAHDLILLNPDQARKGAVEVRGQIFDVGRLDRGDARLGGYSERLGAGQWPRPGDELVLHITSVTDAAPAVTPGIRALALEPWKFEGQRVTVTGSFRGRNLFGDLPDAPGKSRYDFVLGGAEGAIWVTGLRPRGRGFDLDVARRLDSNRWVEVTGTVARERGLVMIAASEIALGNEPKVAPVVETDVPPTVAPPAEVVFSSPTADETDVPPGTTIRIQFSRGIQDGSLGGHIRVSYAGAANGERPPEFQAAYDAATRSIQIKFAQPLEPFRTVRVELLPGVTAFDGGPVSPWSISFSVGR